MRTRRMQRRVRPSRLLLIGPTKMAKKPARLWLPRRLWRMERLISRLLRSILSPTARRTSWRLQRWMEKSRQRSTLWRREKKSPRSWLNEHQIDLNLFKSRIFHYNRLLWYYKRSLSYKKSVFYDGNDIDYMIGIKSPFNHPLSHSDFRDIAISSTSVLTF